MSDSEPKVYAVRLDDDGKAEMVPIPGVASASFDVESIVYLDELPPMVNGDSIFIYTTERPV